MPPIEGFPRGMLHLADRSLQQIEQFDYGDPPSDATRLIRTCLLLTRKPLGEFDDEDLRIMIGQRFSLPILVPVAIGALQADPWLEGDMWTGALTVNVSRIDQEYWHAHPAQAASFEAVIDQMLAPVDADPWCDPPSWSDRTDDDADGEAVWGLSSIADVYWAAHPDQAARLEGVVGRMLAALENNPGLAAPVDTYSSGAGLRTVCGLNADYWRAHPDQRARLDRIVARAWDMGLFTAKRDGPRPAPPAPSEDG